MSSKANDPSASPEGCISAAALSGRWSVSARTLANWRWQGTGCKYLKLGRRVVYRLTDVVEFERQNAATVRDRAEPGHTLLAQNRSRLTGSAS